MDHPNVQVIVAGAGIGGLTAAIALAQRGHRVRVLERAPAIQPVGAGLTVQINAMRALSRLGVADAVAHAGQVVTGASIRHWRGDIISQNNLGAMAESLGAPTVAIHRAELHRVLMEALPDVPVQLDTTVDHFEQDDRGVRVTLTNGTVITGDILVAADGIHSAIRAQLHGKQPPQYAGYTSWRGVCDNHGLMDPEHVSETWGDAQRFGLVPIGQGRLYWFAVADAPQGEKDPPDVKSALLQRFDGWHAPITRVLEATSPKDILRTDICDRPPLTRWGEGRVTLLGDAAHPMTPNLGQGACMAIEDAVVLASALGEQANPAQALQLYATRRLERTTTVVTTARRFGRLGQLSNVAARAVRDAVIHATPDSLTEKQMRWLYQFDGA